MSDSDELDKNSDLALQNASTSVSLSGPNINTSKMRINFGSNSLLPNKMNQRNFDRPNYAKSNYDQGSSYNGANRRRETSPMSVMSACDVYQRNFNNNFSYYQRAISTQRSVIHGRSGSPMSMRSMRTMESSVSISADEIVMALKNANFNKFDKNKIINAAKTYMKNKGRKRIQRKRRLRLNLKGIRRRSGYDSGDLGSVSSASSEDRSTLTSKHKTIMPSFWPTKEDEIAGLRPAQSDSISNYNYTDSSRQNCFRGTFGGSVNLNSTHRSTSSLRSLNVLSLPQKEISQAPGNHSKLSKPKNISVTTQKERFQTGLLLPSHRFNRSVVSTNITEGEDENQRVNNKAENIPNSNINKNRNGHMNVETDSEIDDIFGGAPKNQKGHLNMEIDSDIDDILFSGAPKHKNTDIIERKRNRDSDDCNHLPQHKRQRNDSPFKPSKKITQVSPSKTNKTAFNNQPNDFEFAKPVNPIKKSANFKSKEKIISKSAPVMSDLLSVTAPVNKQCLEVKEVNKNEKEHEINNEEQSNATQNSSDISMRPSFIKRKLFTQKIDVSEKKNTSADNLINSPQQQNSVYGAIHKEKNKARKLQHVTTQSCLSRDIQQDESNLLDLIHKIVPPDRMNITNQTNKTKLQLTKHNADNEEKLDVTSIITSKTNDEELSDTYTDEEVFNATVKTAPVNDVSKQPSSVHKSKFCKVRVVRMPPELLPKPISNTTLNDTTKKSVKDCIKTFWDTDFESDSECSQNIYKKQIQSTYNQPLDQVRHFRGFQSSLNADTVMTTVISPNSNTSCNPTHETTKYSVNKLKIKSHRNSKRKPLEQLKEDDAKCNAESVSNKADLCSSIDSNLNTTTQKIKLKDTSNVVDPPMTHVNLTAIERKKDRKLKSKPDKPSETIKVLNEHALTSEKNNNMNTPSKVTKKKKKKNTPLKSSRDKKGDTFQNPEENKKSKEMTTHRKKTDTTLKMSRNEKNADTIPDKTVKEKSNFKQQEKACKNSQYSINNKVDSDVKNVKQQSKVSQKSKEKKNTQIIENNNQKLEKENNPNNNKETTKTKTMNRNPIKNKENIKTQTRQNNTLTAIKIMNAEPCQNQTALNDSYRYCTRNRSRLNATLTEIINISSSRPIRSCRYSKNKSNSSLI